MTDNCDGTYAVQFSLPMAGDWALSASVGGKEVPWPEAAQLRAEYAPLAAQDCEISGTDGKVACGTSHPIFIQVRARAAAPVSGVPALYKFRGPMRIHSEYVACPDGRLPSFGYRMRSWLPMAARCQAYRQLSRRTLPSVAPQPQILCDLGVNHSSLRPSFREASSLHAAWRQHAWHIDVGLCKSLSIWALILLTLKGLTSQDEQLPNCSSGKTSINWIVWIWDAFCRRWMGA